MEDDFDINDDGRGLWRALAICLPIGALMWVGIGYALWAIL